MKKLMKKLMFVLIVGISYARLIPTPFITEPETLQRVGNNYTFEYFNARLIGETYGITMVKPRGTNSTLMILSDESWHRLIYTNLIEGGRQEAKYLRAYGEFGSSNGQFYEPKGLCVDTTIYNGITNEYAIYIADRWNSRIVKIKYLIAQDTIVADGIFASGLNNPTDIACISKKGGGTYIVVIEKDMHRIRLYQRSMTGVISLIQNYGNQGSGYGQFFRPNGVAICVATGAPGGYFIYVTDTGNRRVVCLRYTPSEGITWQGTYRTMENAHFLSVTASQYYCVYVTDFIQNKVWVFTPGLSELLYTYGDANLLNSPKDICIDWDRIGLTEQWTATTGIQYFKIIPEIGEFYPEPGIFDATEDSVKINFRVDETANWLTMTVGDKVLIDSVFYQPGYQTVYWNGRDSSGNVVLPDTYEITIHCGSHLLGSTDVIVKGTQVSGMLDTLEHWTEEGEPYVLTGNVQLPYNGYSSSRLVIDPGVKVMPTGNYMISTFTGSTVSNKLIAQGTAINPILFTPHRKLYPEPDTVSKGSWKGIIFANNVAGDSLVLEHCVIEAAGSDSAAITVSNKPVVVNINNSEIIKSSSYGFREDFSRALSRYTTIITNSKFEDNDSISIRVGFASIDNVHDNTYVNNGVEVVDILPASLNESATIRNESVSYWFRRRSGYQALFEILSNDTSYCPVLTIEPGISMFFEGDTRLLACNGGSTQRAKIIACGTAQDSIIFTALDTTQAWYGIGLYLTNPMDTSVFEYCRISYGGHPEYYGRSGNLFSKTVHTPYILRHSTISHSQTLGIHHQSGGGFAVNPLIESNQITDNDSFPIVTYANALRGISDNFMAGNKYNDIFVNTEQRVNQSLLWHNQGVPYVINGEIMVNGYGDTVVTVTIESGNIIKFKSGGSGFIISADDILIAENTIFTKADANPWTGGLNFNSAGNSILDSCTIEHYWHDNYNYSAVEINNSSIEITNSVISNNSAAINVNGSSNVTFTNNRIILNQNGINVRSAPLSMYVKNNDFSGNKCAFLSVTGTGFPYAVADSNWWGDASGPWDPVSGDPLYNPSGRGDSIGAHVYYDPWLTAPVQPQVVTLTNPNGGEVLYGASPYSINWETSVDPVHQELYYTDDYPEGGSKENAFWQFIDSVPASENKYLWNVASKPSNRYRLAIKINYNAETKCMNERSSMGDLSRAASLPSLSASASRSMAMVSMDISDANFEVVDTVKPSITVLKPAGGEYFIAGKRDTVKWQASDNHGLKKFAIYLSLDGGQTYPDTIARDLGPTIRSYLWTPPEKDAYNCRIKISACDSSENFNEDCSDSAFYIPVKSLNDEMTAFNNGRRLIRQSGSRLYLVYTTAESSERNAEMDEQDPSTVDQSSKPAIRDDYRSVSKVYYRKSTNMGITWETGINLGDGVYPVMGMNDGALHIGVCWLNASQTRVCCKYATDDTWSNLDTLLDEVSGISYEPISAWFMTDTMHLVTLRNTELGGGTLLQDIIYLKYQYNNPGVIVMNTVNHWRLVNATGYLPRMASLSVAYDRTPYIVWERPPGDTIFSGTLPELDIFYAWFYRGKWDVFNVSQSPVKRSINPALDWYGGHTYLVWQEQVNGDYIFLYNRNYLQTPPSYQTDTIGQVAGSPVYPVSRKGGVVLWSEGTPQEIYGRVYDSEGRHWEAIENWSNTLKSSRYPLVDAWNNEGGTDIIAGWTEAFDTCGLGRRFVSLFPAKDCDGITFPSYNLNLGDSLSTPFTKYRDGVTVHDNRNFDVGIDSLVYYLPYIDIHAKCRVYMEIYRPILKDQTMGGDKWKIRLDIDGAMHHNINLSAGEFKIVELNVPAVVNSDGKAIIKFEKIDGEYILVRRILFYEFERNEEVTLMQNADGCQGSETQFISPVLLSGLYPNPAKGILRIRLRSPDEQQMKIVLYDITGRIVNEIFNGKVVQGVNEIQMSTNKLAAGVYFMRVETDKTTEIEKVIIVK